VGVELLVVCCDQELIERLLVATLKRVISRQPFRARGKKLYCRFVQAAPVPSASE